MPNLFKLLSEQDKKFMFIDLGKNPNIYANNFYIDGFAIKSLDEINDYELVIHEPASECE